MSIMAWRAVAPNASETVKVRSCDCADGTPDKVARLVATAAAASPFCRATCKLENTCFSVSAGPVSHVHGRHSRRSTIHNILYECKVKWHDPQALRGWRPVATARPTARRQSNAVERAETD